MKPIDVLVIGGGISGLMSARELAKSGMRVILLERQAIAKESSWAGGGILSPLYPWRYSDAVTALCGWSQAAYPALAEELMGSTGIDPEWLKSGLLVSDCDDLERARRWVEAHRIRCEFLSSADVGRIEPQISGSTLNPLLFPDISQVRNPRLLRCMRKDLTQRGVEMLEGRPVNQIKVEHGKVVRVESGQEIFTAHSYVLAAGAWTGLISRNSGLPDLPILPVKGEMLIFDSPPGLLNKIVLSKGRYLIPRKDGKIITGSTVENAQFDKSITEKARESLLDFACDLLPPLRRIPVEKQWSGLRPGSPGGIPLIGAHPEISNLYLNCGHFRNGFVMAPASARLLADLILQRPAIVSPQPYLPLAEVKTL